MKNNNTATKNKVSSKNVSAKSTSAARKTANPKMADSTRKSATAKPQGRRSLDDIVANTNAPGPDNPGFRMLAQDFYVNNDSYVTRLNNNDVIIGASGRGKTTSYVDPLISQKCGSMIITDTKNCLYDRHVAELRAAGYKVMRLDMLGRSESCSYNPLDFIAYNPVTDRYSEQDITTIAELLCPLKAEEKDPFWPSSAQIFLTALIGFIMEATPKADHTPYGVLKLFKSCINPSFSDSIFEELESENPDSFAVTRYKMFKSVTQAEKTYSCIMIFVANALVGFDLNETSHIFNAESSFDFKDIGNEKTAFFLNVSDSDRSCDRLVNIFYSQAMNKLLNYADTLPEKRLNLPVRFILDDFATNTVIPNFSNLISVIRSRDISVSIILQSISQLNEKYSVYESNTILSNCDHMLFLGTPEVETAKYIGEKMNVPYYNVLNMPLDTAYVFESGNSSGGISVNKYRPAFVHQTSFA